MSTPPLPTADPIIVLRQGLLAHLSALRTAAAFVRNTFALAETYIPFHLLTTIPPGGQVWLVALDSNEELYTRGGGAIEEIPVGVALQSLVADRTDLAEMNTLTLLRRQLRAACRTLVLPGYSWLRTAAHKDRQTDMPFSFTALREASTYEAYWLAYYSIVT